ncbi:hypothetical protein IAT40_003088 [Kwoniella sp. CBS 6097]
MANDNDYIPLATSPATAENDVDVQRERVIRGSHRHFAYLPAFLRSKPRLVLLSLALTVLPLLLLVSLGAGNSPSQPEEPIVLLPVHDNPYFHNGDVWKHNDEVAARLDRCASLGLLRNTSMPLAPHDRLSDEEESELIAEGCGTNQTTVVILASLWFALAYAGTDTAGESVYAQSVISTLNAHNYSYVFTSLGWWNHDMRKTVELWRRHRWNTRLVLADPEQVDVCYKLTEQECLKTKENMEGIEPWRVLSFWYWDDPRNPLGTQFTLSPSPRNDNHFLSYSIEPTCRRLPYLPTHERAHPPQAYLLAKQMHYLEDKPEFSWTLPTLKGLETQYSIRVVAGMKEDDDETSKRVKEIGLTNFGRLGKIEFYEQLARSFVFVGVGRPRISPSPWDALCMGVPFINPILTWDEEDPLNRTKWHAQQWHMTDLNPPFVYSVKAHDLDGLSQAVGEALANPIESYIPDYMKFDFACQKTAELIEGDWRGKAEKLLEERIANGGQTFEL